LNRTIAFFVAAFVIGVIAQLSTRIAAGEEGTLQARSMLHARYWLFIAYPSMVLACGILGYLEPRLRVRLAGAVLLGDILTVMIFFSTGGHNLLPIGLIVYVVLFVPCAVAAWLGGFLRKKSDAKRTHTK